MEWVMTGHGGNIALQSRKYRDCQASILEVAGSASNPDSIRKMESLWIGKLRGREMWSSRN